MSGEGIGIIVIGLAMIMIGIYRFRYPDESSLFGVSWLFKDKQVSDNIRT